MRISDWSSDVCSSDLVSGVRGIADLPGGASGNGILRTDTPLLATDVDGAGGAITLNATTGLIAGELRLAPGGATGLGGRLAFTGTNASTYRVKGATSDLDPVTADGEIPTGGVTLSAAPTRDPGAADTNGRA